MPKKLSDYERRRREREREAARERAERAREARRRRREREREHERRQRQHEREREREREQARREREAAERERELDEEFAAWQEDEREVEKIAVPSIPLNLSLSRLEKRLEQRKFEEKAFCPIAFHYSVFERKVKTAYWPKPFDFEKPEGPNAGIVDAIREEALRSFEESHPPVAPPALASALSGVAGGAVVYFLAEALAVMITGQTQMSDSFWTVVFVAGGVLVGSLFWRQSIVASSAAVEARRREEDLRALLDTARTRAAQAYAEAEAALLKKTQLDLAAHEAAEELRARAHAEALAQASAAHEKREAQRRSEWEAEQAAARAKFEQKEEKRLKFVRGRLEGETGAMEAELRRRIPIKSLSFYYEAAARARDAKTVEVAFEVPDKESLPQTIKRRTAKGLTQRQRNEKELSGLHRRTVAGLGLRHAAEVMAYLPTVERVLVDGWSEYVDPADGHSYLQCVLTLDVRRSKLKKLELEAVVPEVALEELNAQFRFRKGEYESQEPLFEDDLELRGNVSEADAESV